MRALEGKVLLYARTEVSIHTSLLLKSTWMDIEQITIFPDNATRDGMATLF